MPIVSACCISHAPQIILDKPSNLEDFNKYEAVSRSIRDDISKVRPDLILFVTNDHFDNFFLNNIPSIAIGVGEQPYSVDAGRWGRPEISYKCESASSLALKLLEELLNRGVDITALHSVTMGMDVLVPMYFLRPEADLPILPIYINDYVNPRPRPQRAYEWGKHLGEILKDQPERVAVIGTGGLSHWTGVPGKANYIDEKSDREIIGMLESGEGFRLAEYTIDELLEHGQHELLNWICVQGMLGGKSELERYFYTPFYDYVTGHAIVSFAIG